MRSIRILLIVLTVIAGSWAEASTIVDVNRYPADISLVLLPDVPISNGVTFFSQTNTPILLNSVLTTFPYAIPADVSTDVGPTFSGGSFGVYRTFTNQYQTFLGTYEGGDGLPHVVALLAEGVGIGKTYQEVFGDQYPEESVIEELVRLGSGNTSGVLFLFEFVRSWLVKQPAYTVSGPDSYVLGPAELVKFSTGTSAGQVVSGAYRIPGVVPEPSSLVLCAVGIAMTGLVGLVRRRNRMGAGTVAVARERECAGGGSEG